MSSFCLCLFFFSSRRRHTRWTCDWSSDVCSSDLGCASRCSGGEAGPAAPRLGSNRDHGVDEQLAARLVAQARSRGISLVGPNGLLQQLTKLVLEGALEGELTDHLGYPHGDPAGRNGANSRNGTRPKTVLTEVGPVDLDVGAGRPGRLAAPPPGCGLPGAVHRRDPGEDPRRQRGQPAHLRRLGRERGRGARHPGTVGRRRRRGRQVLDAGPHRDQEPRRGRCVHRGLRRPDRPARRHQRGVAPAHPQTCVVHLLRNSFRYASRKDWATIARDLRPIYTAPTEAAALEALASFAAAWEARYPAIIRLWEHAWAEFVPFLTFDAEIRTIICTTNAIESLNARFRRSVKARGHFPNEQAALKHLYLTVVSLDPTGRGRRRWTNRWKAALNAFDITFDGRVSAGRK